MRTTARTYDLPTLASTAGVVRWPVTLCYSVVTVICLSTAPSDEELMMVPGRG